MKKPFLKRMGDFLEGRGFYIVLFLCVAAIGISGYYLFSSLSPEDPGTAVNGPAQVTVTPSAPPTARQSAAPEHSIPVTTPKPVVQNPAVYDTPSPTPAAQPSSTPAAAPTTFVWPVEGEVLAGYSVETLAYDETMGDWRAHAGLDLAADAGAEVQAAASGTVTDVVEDALMGTSIVIDHGAGLTSTYSNLAAAPMAEVGDTVLAGEVIGAVGDTAIAESAMADHLHFVMTQDGAPVDPMDYLPN